MKISFCFQMLLPSDIYKHIKPSHKQPALDFLQFTNRIKFLNHKLVNKYIYKKKTIQYVLHSCPMHMHKSHMYIGAQIQKYCNSQFSIPLHFLFFFFIKLFQFCYSSSHYFLFSVASSIIKTYFRIVLLVYSYFCSLALPLSTIYFLGIQFGVLVNAGVKVDSGINTTLLIFRESKNLSDSHVISI